MTVTVLPAERTYTYPEALDSLYPGAQWRMSNDMMDINNLEWLDTEVPKPSADILNAEVQRLQTAWDNTRYQRLRAREYPPITDYLDGVVKGDQDQIQAYIAACTAVKQKYPKPE